LATAALAACTAQKSPSGDPINSPSATTGGDQPTGPIRWANWPDYIDVAGKRRPSLAAFVQESGIKVEYSEVINDNAEFLGTVSDALAAQRTIGYDVVTLTTWAAAKVVGSGWAQEFGPIENVDNLIPALAAPDWDPEQRFSMPWQAGLTGIAYDARKVDRAIGSVSELFERADLKGKVGLLTERNDTIGLTLLARGHDLADLTADDIGAANASLAELAADGRFGGFYGNDFIDAMADGDIVASMAWSGDVLQAQAKNPYLKFVIPEEGLMIWSDNLVMPRASDQAGAVAKLAAYYYQPKVAAQVAAWVNYICPVQGAQAEMEKIDPDLAKSPLIFPDRTILDRSSLFPSLPTDVDEAMQRDFAAAIKAQPK
jgi:spermidine/putrescine transport system substrate-binding protein